MPTHAYSLFCFRHRSRDAFMFLPFFLSGMRTLRGAHAFPFLIPFSFFLLPGASLSNVCVRLPAMVRARAAPVCNSSIHLFSRTLVRSSWPSSRPLHTPPTTRTRMRIRIRSPKSPKSSNPTPPHQIQIQIGRLHAPLCLASASLSAPTTEVVVVPGSALHCQLTSY
jgi:hypothetical protein